MTKDLNKNISQIRYNFVNLPNMGSVMMRMNSMAAVNQNKMIVAVVLSIFIFFLGCESKKTGINGRITTIYFDLLQNRYECRNQIFIETSLHSDKDMELNIQNQQGNQCDLNNISQFSFVLNDVVLPVVLVSNDSLKNINLTKETKTLNFLIQQGVYPNTDFYSYQNMGIEERRKRYAKVRGFYKILNSDSLIFSYLEGEGEMENIRIKADEETKVLFYLNEKRIKPREFVFNELGQINPPPVSVQ